MYTYSQTHTHTARTHPPNRLPHTHTYTHGAHEHTEENPTTDMEDVTVADTKGKTGTKKRRMPAKTPTAQKPKRRAPITVKVPCVWVYAHSCVCARVHACAHIHCRTRSSICSDVNHCMCAKMLMLID